ncbi:MAG: oligosaccharide flippase family protein [Cytophagaceae bacterium]|nr:oligosaccharide flippase family protein [Cytophagaceae bacterium]
MSVIKRQTILGTFFSYLGVIVGTLTQAIIFPKYLNTEEVGLFAMIFNWTLILVFVVTLGFNSSGTRFFEKFRNEEKKHNGYLFSGFLFLLIGTTLVSIILMVFKNQIIGSSKGDTELFEKYYYLILPLTISVGVFNIFDNYAKGLYETVMGNFLSQFLQRFLVFFAVLFYILELYNFQIFVIVWATALIVPTIIMYGYCVGLGGFSILPNNFLFKSSFLKEFVRFAAFSILTGLSSIVITKVDSLLVYEYLGLGQIGIYNFCLLFGSVMTISYNVNLKASTAIVLDALSKNDIPKINQIFIKSSQTQTLFGVALLLIVWLNIDSFFEFIKPEYAIGKYVILIIGISKIFDLASGINSLIMVYSRYYKIDSILVVSFVGLLFLLNHFFIPLYGLNGAAIAALVATFYYNIMRNILIWKYFRIHPYSTALLKIIGLGISIFFIVSFMPDFRQSLWYSFFTMVYKSSIALFIFITSTYFLKINNDVNSMLDNNLRKLISFLK